MPLFKFLSGINAQLPTWLKSRLSMDEKLIAEAEHHYGIRVEPTPTVYEEWSEGRILPAEMREDLRGWDTGHSYDN